MMSSPVKLSELRRHITEGLKAGEIADPDLEARWFLSRILNIAEIKLWTEADKEASTDVVARVEDFIRRRVAGEPFAYIVGVKEFFGREFVVNKHTLIPRPESELIIHRSLEFLKKQPVSCQIADFGTGSGCLGLTVLCECPTAKLIAVDISSEAITVASENAQKLNVPERVQFLNEDVVIASERLGRGTFDLVVANPPYIDVSDADIEGNVKKYEPHLALFADDEGYKLIGDWAKAAARILKPGGLYLCEIGAKQADRAVKMIENLNSFDDIQVLKDYSHKPRIISAKKNAAK